MIYYNLILVCSCDLGFSRDLLGKSGNACKSQTYHKKKLPAWFEDPVEKKCMIIIIIMIIMIMIIIIIMIMIIVIIVIIIIMIMIIIITRPKPAYGRQGLAGGSLRASSAQLGSDHFSLQTHKHCIKIYIYHHNIVIIIIMIMIIMILF